MRFESSKVITIICILLLSLTTVMTSCSPSMNPKVDIQERENTTVSEQKQSAKSSMLKKRKKENKELKPGKVKVVKNKYREIIENSFKDINAYQSSGIYSFDNEAGFETENSQEPFVSASVVKLFIAEYTLLCIDSGNLSYDSIINGQSVRNLLTSMITVSDNSAANAFIDHFGMDTLNESFISKGYTATKIERRMLDFAAQQNGKENYTSTQDVMMLLKKIYLSQNLSAYSDLLDIMKRQQVKTKIQLNLPPGVTAANKTGELSNVENDVGIIFTPGGDYAVCFLLNKVTANSSARKAISDCVNMLCE